MPGRRVEEMYDWYGPAIVHMSVSFAECRLVTCQSLLCYMSQYMVTHNNTVFFERILQLWLPLCSRWSQHVTN